MCCRHVQLANLILLISLPLVAGCTHSSGSNKTGPTAKPSGTPTPFPLSVRVDGAQSTITDLAGVTIAKISADRALLAPTEGAVPSDPIGMLEGASAILYQHNKPVATLIADKMHADRDARIVIGTGNVKIRSLQQIDSPAIRADKMTWRYNDNTVVGEGNVVVTRNPDVQLPGKRFVSDTVLRKFTLYSDDKPATGTF